ncbi:MAG: TIGR04255 family protein [Acidobacteriota bacterium]|nr:TIGR04255 family protein [Acidobacteriota bacterium]
MRIETFDRVVYEHNPLAEVICQVAFEPLELFTDDNIAAFQMAFAELGFPHAQRVTMSFGPPPSAQGAVAPGQPPVWQQVRVDHFVSADGFWKVSLSAEFIALTCLKYAGWTEFLPRVLAAARALAERCPAAVPLRLGLRYKDVVEREPLNLGDTPWHELIQPFLLGPMAPNALAHGQTASEHEVESFLSQSLLKLDNSMVLLQSSLLRSIDGARRAFLIDADFYNSGGLESNLLGDAELLRARLHALHEHAGALFRRGITERLHNALRPR